MTEEDFTIELGRLIDTFGPKPFTRGRVALIKSIMYQRSHPTMNRIVSQFIATMRMAPLPKDFKEAAAQEARWDVQKADNIIEQEPDKIDCNMCCDTGFNFCIDMEGMELLCRCVCESGERAKDSQPEIPLISSPQAAHLALKVLEFPMADFKPTNMGKNAKDQKVAWWKEQLIFSRSFWREFARP